jgi:hypothetical protein
MIAVDNKLVENKNGNTRLQAMYFYQGRTMVSFAAADWR